ncbi:MAG TPA: sigma-70 family RNA polymerase sigma factor [Fimbriiglobus sp.]|jgi:RNA polymerase sigma-70 factor (ECF subfamily)
MTGRQIAELIDRYTAALTLYARQWCASPEDAVQEAFCKLVGLRVPPDDPAGWLFRTTKYAAIDRGKADRRRTRREAAVARPDWWFVERTIEGLDAADAVVALDALPADQREVIVARLWGSLSLEQTATMAGCSVSSAHRRYEAGIALLRERLGVKCPTP